ncbi:MAG: nucleotide exchange factor GrpE [Tissierellia bacterium]|nr:nucleotide exchange factor GrpE [Tissierellia bacterium]
MVDKKTNDGNEKPDIQEEDLKNADEDFGIEIEDAEIIEENDEIVETKTETDELKDSLIRLQADFQNFRKRVDKERESLIDLGVKKLALELLPVLDNLERALDSIKQREDSADILQGIDLIDDQIVDVLAKEGVKKMKALGEVFDPNFHHAVAIDEDSDYEADHICEVLQTGYTFKDTCLRPAMVKVAK